MRDEYFMIETYCANVILHRIKKIITMDNAWGVDDNDYRLHCLWTCEKSHHIFGLTIEIQKKRKIQRVLSFCLHAP